MGNNYTFKRKVIDEVSASFYISMSGFIGHFFVILVEVSEGNPAMRPEKGRVL